MSFTSADYAALLAELAAQADPAYRQFNESLLPGIHTAYGVRLPVLRSLAKRIVQQDPRGFFAVADAKTDAASFEETLLRGFVIAAMPADIPERLALTGEFLPRIDNWSVCDAFCASFRFKTPEERAAMWAFLRPLFQEPREFHARFAAVMFLSHFVESDTVEEGLALLAQMNQPQYYVQMAAAWAVSVCYIRFPGKTLALLEQRVLPAFTQNMSVRKLRESRRVSAADKAMLLRYKL